jgi:drug/metabolite transporter (DMT)-like permease
LRRADVARLTLLGAIWGASFLFIRIVSPALGPLLAADLRMLVAGIALLAWFRLLGFDPQWRRWMREYVILGILTSGLPFLLYAYGALSLTAGQLSVLNATAPMWGALMAAALLGERLTARRSGGLLLGVAGVALIARPGGGETLHLLPVAACLGAAGCYGFSAAYLKRWARAAPAKGLAVGTQVSAGLLMLPLAALFPPAAPPSALVIACVAALGLVCGALAYLLYFRLIQDVGPAGALTVTYLTPLFGMLWGAAFLGEALTVSMLAGAALVILGTVLVLRN